MNSGEQGNSDAELRRLRRLAREAKRERQRHASYERAAKMHEARLQNPVVRAAHPAPWQSQKYHVGCSGWFYWHWRGNFYPEDLPRTDWFRHYAETFDTVELNAPFYSWPTLASVKTWIQQAEHSGSFVYTVKVSELITHVKKFEGTEELVLDFGYIADLLGSRFGCFLFQLPPSFAFTTERLEAIVSQLDPARRNVVEFRHGSWWNREVYRAFKKRGIIFCSCSGPRLPDELVRTADDIYARFHGTSRWYRHDYTIDELTVWADRIRGIGARRAWVYFNNDRDGYAIKNARQLLSLLGDRPF
ncbi:MAG TPA: DUF72 domain-containing protein [Fimbriimonadaceae bacterium]|nr:DUF72 domain-containing protein [Fimbriimonadaceae bacterium]